MVAKAAKASLCKVPISFQPCFLLGHPSTIESLYIERDSALQEASKFRSNVLRSLIFILLHLLVSSVLQSLTASQYAQKGRRTRSLHAPCSLTLLPPVWGLRRGESLYSH